MNVDDLKVIWDSQNKEPLYAIDQKALRKRVLGKSLSANRRLNLYEWTGILTFACVGVASIAEPLIAGRDWHQLISGSTFLMVSAYLGLKRHQRRKRDTQCGESLREILDTSIATVEHHIRALKSMVYWGGIPFVGAVAISFYFQHAGKPAWLWILAFVWPFFAFWEVRREIHHRHLPQLRDFQSLRDKLADSEGSTKPDIQA